MYAHCPPSVADPRGVTTPLPRLPLRCLVLGSTKNQTQRSTLNAVATVTTNTTRRPSMSGNSNVKRKADANGADGGIAKISARSAQTEATPGTAGPAAAGAAAAGSVAKSTRRELEEKLASAKRRYDKLKDEEAALAKLAHDWKADLAAAKRAGPGTGPDAVKVARAAYKNAKRAHDGFDSLALSNANENVGHFEYLLRVHDAKHTEVWMGCYGWHSIKDAVQYHYGGRFGRDYLKLISDQIREAVQTRMADAPVGPGEEFSVRGWLGWMRRAEQ